MRRRLGTLGTPQGNHDVNKIFMMLSSFCCAVELRRNMHLSAATECLWKPELDLLSCLLKRFFGVQSITWTQSPPHDTITWPWHHRCSLSALVSDQNPCFGESSALGMLSSKGSDPDHCSQLVALAMQGHVHLPVMFLKYSNAHLPRGKLCSCDERKELCTLDPI